MKRLGNNSQKGAVLVFVALLLPMLVFFGGMAIDFGRAYLYKSDLQNAADAAALAGVVAASQSSKARLIDDAPANKTTPADVAVIKSRAVSASNVTLVKDIGRAGASDANTKLFTDPQNTEDDEEQNDTYYYMVELTDEVRMVFARLFLPDSLLPDGWNIKVVARAWAKAGDGKKGPNLLEQTDKVAKLYTAWNFDAYQKETGGNKTVAQGLSYTNLGTTYGTDGSRSEIFNMDGTEGDKNVRRDLFINFKQDVWYPDVLTEDFDVTALQNLSYEEARELFYANGKKFVNVMLPGSTTASGEWTWDNVVRELGKRIGSKNGDMWKNLTERELTWEQISEDERAIMWKALTSSISGVINVTNPFPVRDVAALPEKEVSLDTEGNPNLLDPLFVRIESEEFNAGYPNSHVSNTVHDISINIKADNTVKDENEKYLYRPMFFVYDGPVDAGDKRGEGRKSNTVVVNLEANFRGIIYAPNSPVYIKVAENISEEERIKFQGFIIADCLVDENGNKINIANEVTTDNAQTFQDFARDNLNLDATFDGFGLVKLNVYNPERDVVYLTNRAAITI